jgi:hypothetical protein
MEDVFVTGSIDEILSNIDEIPPQTSEGSYTLFIPENQESLDTDTFCAVIYEDGFAENDELPQYAVENNLVPILEVSIAFSIVNHAKSQKLKLNSGDLVKALNYYLTNDAYVQWDSTA